MQVPIRTHIASPTLIGNNSSKDNLLVTEWAPQLSHLEHADDMVNHGGLNSIMECVQKEVPIVILPCARDQPGNAARAEFHHLALRGKIDSIEPDGLLKLVNKALTDTHLKAGLKKMKETIGNEQGLQKAVAFIEDFSAKPQRELDAEIQP